MIDLDYIARGTHLTSPNGGRYYVSDFDEDERGTYLWIKRDGANRRRRLYQDQATGWAVESGPAEIAPRVKTTSAPAVEADQAPAVEAETDSAPFKRDDRVTYQGRPLVVVRLDTPGKFVEMATPEWDGKTSRGRGIWAPVGDVEAYAPPPPATGFALPRLDEHAPDAFVEYHVEQCRKCGEMGPPVDWDNKDTDPNVMWGHRHLEANPGHDRVYVWTLTRATGQNIVFPRRGKRR
ncbi:hypothetical protein [Actinomadura sp. NEAU-AAG7]|uniref:hypothetical protein n=1 Tax=Actinomadura sp. NEAU-AAG7 TaxID=2839640 RepID=UPI001BE4D7CB|nr:hypothetical protein [Actinomadura sp. NEAU-AAG7]MBT2213495.1 hypothetical protein [Actinomadura sp. NEAU-AAG7]